MSLTPEPVRTHDGPFLPIIREAWSRLESPAAAGRHPVPQIVQKEIAPDYLWNAKSSDLQSVVIENILKELAAENENAAREGKRPFKFVGVRAAQKHTQYMKVLPPALLTAPLPP